MKIGDDPEQAKRRRAARVAELRGRADLTPLRERAAERLDRARAWQRNTGRLLDAAQAARPDGVKAKMLLRDLERANDAVSEADDEWLALLEAIALTGGGERR